jgi:hypothetical protein
VAADHAGAASENTARAGAHRWAKRYGKAWPPEVDQHGDPVDAAHKKGDA